jgi:hypothetical protein
MGRTNASKEATGTGALRELLNNLPTGIERRRVAEKREAVFFLMPSVFGNSGVSEAKPILLSRS